MRKLLITYDKNENVFIKSLRVLSLLVALFCVCLEFVTDVRYSIWFLPVSYSLGLILLGYNNVVKFTPGIITLNIVMFCRYSVLPLVMSLSNELSVFAKQYGNVQTAIIVMWFELIAILVTIFFSGVSMRKRVIALTFQKKDSAFYEIRYGNISGIVVLCIIVFLMVRYPFLIGGIDLLIKGYIDNPADILNISGFVGMLWKSCTIWLSIYSLSYLKKKNVKGALLTLVLVSIIVIFVLISFIGQVSISRWYTVVTFCALFFSVVKLFPNQSKTVTKWIIIPAVMMLLVTSVFKNTDYILGNISFSESVLELFDISTLDSYFAGPVSVNNGLYLKQNTSVNISCMIYDLLRNFPVVNHYINTSSASVEMYHIYLGRGDQILPLVGQSMIYFGYGLLPILSIISVVLVRYFDYRFLKSQTMIVYMYAFIACWLGLVTILNFTICVSWMYASIIPSILVIKFTEGFGKKKLQSNKKLGD